MKFFKVDESRFTHDYIQMLQIIMLNSLGFFFIGFWIPIIARENMGASAFQISIVVVSWVVGRMVSGFVTGFISDHVKSRTSLVLTGSFGRGISYFIIYTAFIANHIYILMIGHAALGLCAGIFWVPFNMFVAEKTSKNHRAYAYGRRDATNAIGQIIGGVFGFIYLMILSTFTSNPFILYIPIPIYGISNFIAGIIFYRKVDESIKFSDENENNSDINTDEILYEKKRSRSMVIGTILLLILLFLSSINGNIARPFLNIYVIENIESNVNLVLWAYLPMGLVATLLAPRLGSFIDKLRPSIGISITWSLGSLLTWLLINATNIWVFSVIMLFDLAIGMSAGLIFQNFYSRISTEHRGKIFGVGDLFAFLGNVIGPILGGMVWDLISPQFPFIISIFVELSLIPLYLIAVHLLIPHMAESYEFKKKEELIPEFEL